MTTLRAIAYARSGDKGSSANIAVFGRTPANYAWLKQHLTADQVEAWFKPLGVGAVVRYDVPNLEALNFVCRACSPAVAVARCASTPRARRSAGPAGHAGGPAAGRFRSTD